MMFRWLIEWTNAPAEVLETEQPQAINFEEGVRDELGRVHYLNAAHIRRIRVEQLQGERSDATPA